MRTRRWFVYALLASALYTSAAFSQTNEATEAAPTVRRVRRVRDRYRNTLSVGMTTGLGSPLGLAGAFVEYRPIRWVAAQVGVGAGGSFGAAVGTALYVDPITLRWWALGVGAAYSHNFAYFSGPIVTGGPSLPAHTDWISVEVQTHIRPARQWFLRGGFGRGFLLDPGAFRLPPGLEGVMVPNSPIPFPTPLDAVRSATRGEGFGVWYFHLDIAFTWRL